MAMNRPSNPPIYIPAAGTLLYQIGHIVMPDDHELQTALGVLSQSPVVGYAQFTEVEIRLLGAYRAFVSQAGGYESVWSSIVEGDWNAWIYAVHEAAELQAFADRSINPFDSATWHSNWQEPHLKGVLAELQFLTDWALQEGWAAPPLAIERENPERKQYPTSHARLIDRLQQRQQWLAPTPAECETATRFWQTIRRRELS
jgi:hypothetical protein